MLNKTVYLTPKGLTKLETELNYLRDVKRLEIIERLQESKGDADWRDNTEFMLIQDELAFVDGRIQELEHMLMQVHLIEPDQAARKLSIGSTAVIQENGRELEKYKIVGAAEANPSEGLISNESPLGQALLDHEAGDEIIVTAPGGNLRFRIIAIM